MGKPARDTLHAARLLQGKLMRIVQRRQHQLDRAQADYRLSLVTLTAESDAGTLDVVQRALDNDRSAPELAADLRFASKHGIIDAEFPEVGDAAPESDDLPPPLPMRTAIGQEPLPPLPESAYPPHGKPLPRPSNDGDGNEAWGIEPLADTLPDTRRGEYRYPEPGEPARQLADGRIVAATEADEAPAES